MGPIMKTRQLIADRYEIVEFIAQGGMGAVYRGRDTDTGEPVAIKALKSDVLGADVDQVQRFIREGETLRTLNHPNIVKLLATVEENEQHYLIMEYVGGGSLADLLHQQPQLPIPQVLAIALELADALTRAHHLKVIHRDIKPANVLLAEDGTPRLTDFGIARVIGSNITGTTSVIGTMPYLPPEAFNSLPLDARADLWSFGIMLFEMLTGQLPFNGTEITAIIAAIVHNPVPDLEALRPDTPVALIDLIYRMLEKNREQRIPSARQVGSELEAIINSLNTPSHPDAWASLRVDLSFLPDSTPTTQTPNNLPVQTTPFVGREHELEELAELIGSADTRLITILGAGGMGKTRLALEAACGQLGYFKRGVYFVSLAPLNAPDQIVATIAKTIGFQFYQAGDPRQQLLDHFREKSILLVLDNFEHLLAGAEIVSAILQVSPGVKVLATSRVKLNLQEETIFRIEGMDFPSWNRPEDVLDYDAVKLFLQSAHRVRPDFTLSSDDLGHVVHICQQVQGLPLGILLAAAWLDVLPLDEIADEITKGIDFLETEQQNVPVRQRSIRAVFDYSWSLLSPEEQTLFARLSVFCCTFTREAAQGIADASLKGLAALVNKSMLRRDPGGRYEIHELLRQYGQEKLNGIRQETCVDDCHCDYYINLVKQFGPHFTRRKQLETLAVLRAEFDNIRTAWERFVRRSEQGDIPEMAHYIAHVCELVGQPVQGQIMFRYAADVLGPEPSQALGTVLAYLALFHWWLGDPEAHEINIRAFTMLEGYPPSEAFVHTLIMSAMFTDDLGERERKLHQAGDLARTYGYDWLRGLILNVLSWVLENQNRFDDMLALADEAILLSQKSEDLYLQASIERYLGYSAMLSDRFDEAKPHYERILDLGRRLGHSNESAAGYDGLSWVAAKHNDHIAHRSYLLSALRFYRNTGQRDQIARTLGNLAHPTVRLGNYEEAVDYVLEAMRIAWQIKSLDYVLKAVIGYADVLIHTEQPERGVELLALAAEHPALLRDGKQAIEQYLQEVTLAPEVIAAAQARGRTLTLDSTVEAILSEPRSHISD